MANWLEYIAYRNSKRIIALSNGIQSGISQSGYPINQISVITNLSNMEKFNINGMFGNMDLNGLEWNENTPTVIYTGAFGHANDVHYLVKIAEEMKKLNPRVKFVIAGEGTGIVHIATGCGAIDNKIGKKLGLVEIAPLDGEAKYIKGFDWLEGMSATNINTTDEILNNLKTKDILL